MTVPGHLPIRGLRATEAPEGRADRFRRPAIGPHGVGVGVVELEQDPEGLEPLRDLVVVHPR